jgi:hypothetical protein
LPNNALDDLSTGKKADGLIPWKHSDAKKDLRETLMESADQSHPYWTQPPAAVWEMD